MKRKLKRRWITIYINSISTKHVPNRTQTRPPHYIWWKSTSWLGTATKMWRVKPINCISIRPLNNWISDNTEIKKKTCILELAFNQCPHTITRIGSNEFVWQSQNKIYQWLSITTYLKLYPPLDLNPLTHMPFMGIKLRLHITMLLQTNGFW